MAPSSNDSFDRDQITNPTEEVITKVVRTVAVHANQPPEDLPPLANVVDPDALGTIFGPRPDGTPRRGGELIFRYAGYRVLVTADQTVEVKPIEEVDG